MLYPPMCACTMMVSGTSYKAKGLGFQCFQVGQQGGLASPFLFEKQKLLGGICWFLVDAAKCSCVLLLSCSFFFILDACAQLALSSGQRHRSACLGASSP